MITIPAEITKVQRLKNRTVNIAINTAELAPSKAGELLAMADFCYVSIKPEAFTAAELEQLDNMKSDVIFGKTLSQRLRNTLYVNYKQDDLSYESFESYYKHKMENLIDHFKEKINS